MSRLKCPKCGAKIREIDEVCEDCGADLHHNIEQEDEMATNVLDEKLSEYIGKRKREKLDEEILNDVDYDSLETRTYDTVEKLSFVAAAIQILNIIVGIILLIVGILNWVLEEIIVAIVLLISAPFVGLPIKWMQLMLENIAKLNKNNFSKRK